MDLKADGAAAGLLAVTLVLLGLFVGWAAAQAEEQGAGDLLLELNLDKDRVYPGQAVVATVTLLVGQAPVRNIQYPVLKGGAYRLSEFAAPRQKGLTRDGRDYAAHEFKATLTPLGSGELQVGPAELGCEILEPAGGTAAFFGGGEPRAVKLRSASVGLSVLPLPAAGRPAGFGGAVGRFRLTRQATPSVIRSGDPVTVTTRIEGVGNLDALSCPPVDLPGVRSYPVRARRTPQGLSCEQVLVPQGSDDLTLPGAAISFFDPQAGRYRTADSGPVRIAVTGAAEQTAAQAPVQADADQSGKRKADGGPLRLLPVLLAGILASGLLVYLARHRRAGIRAQTVAAPSAEAGLAAWLAEARQALAADDPVRFHTAVYRALQVHLGASYGLAAAAITGEVVARVLRPGGVEDALLRDYEALFLICDRARFSPGGDRHGDMHETYRLLERVTGRG